jgi:uncharacterized membrane protein
MTKAPGLVTGSGGIRTTACLTRTPRAAERTASQILAYCMGAMLIGSEVAHFVVPAKFDWMVPAELPGGQRFYTYASGAAEIATGGLLLAPHSRRFGATAAAALPGLPRAA